MSQTQSQPQTTGEKLARSALEEIRALRDEVTELRDENEQLTEQVDALTDRVDELEDERERMRARYDAKTDHSHKAVAEIQERELEKGAHLRADNVVPDDLELDTKLEPFEGDDGTDFVRLPNTEDPLERSGDSAIPQADLLPIQQLARLDEDMLQNTVKSFPTRIAAEAWAAMADDYNNPWSTGGASIDKYLMSSDLKSWIRRNYDGISDDYASKLAQRTMDAIEELSSSRLYSKKKSQRKNGLEYTERRVILSSDADIPGQMSSSVTEDKE